MNLPKCFTASSINLKPLEGVCMLVLASPIEHSISVEMKSLLIFTCRRTCHQGAAS